MAYRLSDINIGISGNIGPKSWIGNFTGFKPSKVATSCEVNEYEGFNIMPRKEIAKIPENIKEVAEELNKHYGMPIDIFIKVLKIEYRKQRVIREKERVRKSIDHMDRLYKKDKELTAVTRALECEDFYEYQ
jgi:hypothetical protein